MVRDLRKRRKIGAPPKRDPLPGERFTIATRVRPELKRRLDAAAEESGRSQAQETELRLERSFDRQGLLPEILGLAYGDDIAADLMRLGAKMKARRHREEAPYTFAAAFFSVCSDLQEAFKNNLARGLFWNTREQITDAVERHLNEFLVSDWRRVTLHAAAEVSDEKSEEKLHTQMAKILRFPRRA